MKHVKYSLEEGMATITLDRPDVYNAFNEEMISELNNILREIRENDSIYIVILTGEGDGFCAGADVDSMPDWDEKSALDYGAYLWGVQNIVRQLREMKKPSIAAINGPAIGAGCDFALACDIRYMAEDAILREGFVKMGLIPGDGGAWLLPRLIGEAKARELLLTGRNIDPEMATSLGLVTEIRNDPVEGAREIGGEIRDLPAKAVQYTNELINLQHDFESYSQKAIEFQWECVKDDEHKEAVAAFLENREPEFDRDYLNES